MATLGLVGMLPIPLSLVWAALSDAAASRGRRREGFVVAGALLAAAGWALAAFAGTDVASLLLVTFLLGAGFRLAHVALQGALVARGRSRAATGRLSAGSVGAEMLPMLALFPLGALLPDRSLGWTAGMGGLAALAAGAALFVPFAREPPPVPTEADPPVPREKFLRWLGSGRFWSLTLVGTLASVAMTPALYLRAYAAAAPALSFEDQRKAELIYEVAAVVAAGAYAVVCRRTRLRTLLPICLLAGATGALAFLARSEGAGPSLDVAMAVTGAGLTLARIAVCDLTMRTVPRSHEALGYLVATGLSQLVAPGLAVPFALYAHLGLAAVVTMSAAAAALSALASTLVPKPLTSGRDAHRV
jgi:hypothetical protein